LSFTLLSDFPSTQFRKRFSSADSSLLPLLFAASVIFTSTALVTRSTATATKMKPGTKCRVIGMHGDYDSDGHSYPIITSEAPNFGVVVELVQQEGFSQQLGKVWLARSDSRQLVTMYGVLINEACFSEHILDPIDEGEDECSSKKNELNLLTT